MNIVVHDSFWIMVFSGYIPSSGIAGSFLPPFPHSFLTFSFFFQFKEKNLILPYLKSFKQ